MVSPDSQHDTEETLSGTTRRVLRWSVPVDDQWHQIGAGKVLHVAVRDDRATVEVWTLERTDMHRLASPAGLRTVRVYGTGQPVAEVDTVHLGTALVPGEHLVWHLFGDDL